MNETDIQSQGRPDSVAPAGAEDRETRVFISYSRRDDAFADRLRDRLGQAGFEAYLDKHDIAAGEDWRGRLGALIEAADIVIFVVSPDSIASKVCDWEVNHAERLGKRILPLACRAFADADVPARLSRLNYVFMRSAEEEASEFARLTEALALDIAWVRMHTRYGELASEWDRGGRPARLLLRSSGIEQAERWRDGRPASAPEFGEHHLDFIAASRKAATMRQRGWIAGLSAVAIAAIALSLFALSQQRAAEVSRQKTVDVLATSDFQQGSAFIAKAETEAEGMALLSRAARGGNQQALGRLWTIFQQRSFWIPAASTTAAPAPQPKPDPLTADLRQRFAHVDFEGQAIEPDSIAVSGNGQRVFTSTGEGGGGEVSIRIWNADGTPITEWFPPPYTGDMWLDTARGHFSQDGRYLAVDMLGWRETSRLAVYDLQSMHPLKADIAASGLLPKLQGAAFASVTFVPASGESEAEMVTVSQRGDAAVFGISEDNVAELARNSHRESVVFAAVSASGEWLMSSSADGVVQVTLISQSERLGSLIRLDQIATSLEQAGPAALDVRTRAGVGQRFELRSPLHARVPVEAGAPQPLFCLGTENTEEGEPPKLAVDHPSGLHMSILARRQIEVTRAGDHAFKAVSPVFQTDLASACLDAIGEHVLTTTNDFRTEIWTLDFARRLGPPLDERPSFGPYGTPGKTDWAMLSPGGSLALVRSSFWDPPNMQHYWFSLWNVANGTIAMDRRHVQDDGDGAPGDDIPDAASFAAKPDALTYFRTARPVSALQLTPPPGVSTWLPDLAEAVGGITYDSESLPVQVADRAARLRRGLAELDAVARQ